MAIEHESVLDALLTTISAISTVGYSPPHPLSTGGKVLAIFLIVGGVLGIALIISVLTEYFMEGYLRGALERRAIDRQIRELNEHYIVSGFGRVGREVGDCLTTANIPFVVLDVSPSALAAAQAVGYLFLAEDASHDEVLTRVGIDRARGLIACADSDTNNVYVTLSARALNPNLFIVARAAYADAEAKLYRAGADRVVSPYVMAGRHMADLASRPTVSDYLGFLFDGTKIDVRIQEVPVLQDSALAGCSIKELHRGVLGGGFVLAVDRGEERIHQVSPQLVVRPGDVLFVIGSGAQLSKVSSIK
jgi:voltage-gated potassium channel